MRRNEWILAEPREHLYTNQTTPYPRAPQLYVSLAARFMPGRRVVSEEVAKSLGVEGSYSGDCSDSVLMTSRGGAFLTIARSWRAFSNRA